MKVFSFAPLPVGVLPWNDPEPCVTVITKLTLLFSKGGLVISPEQEPLCHPIPSLFGADVELHHPSDFVPRKERCDVLLTGSAYAAMPLSAIGARVRVGTVHKRFFALAGQEATAIPLSRSYLRSKRRFDSEEVTVSTLSPLHPERARFADVEAALEGAPLSVMAIPRDFDFAYFNAAPDDQQVDELAPGTAISLEGLSPDGGPVSGVLPETWPQMFALTPEGAQIVEVPLTCDTLWIDTDRRVCELTLRGTWRTPPAPRGKRDRAAPRVLPIGFVVRLRDAAGRREPLLLADLPRAVSTPALYPEDVSHIAAAPAEIEPDAIELEPEEIEPEAIELEPLAAEESTVDRKPLAAEAPRASTAAASAPPPRPTTIVMPSAEEAESASRRALGRLGAMMLTRPPAPEMPPPVAPPAMVEGPRRTQTLTTTGPAPKRQPTLTMNAPAPKRSHTLPFAKVPDEIQPPAPSPSISRRPKTLDLSPGARASRAALPFAGAREPAAGVAPPIDAETARARFLALTSAPSARSGPPRRLGAITLSDAETKAALALVPGPPQSVSAPPIVSAPPPFAAPEMPDAPWVARAAQAAQAPMEAAPISRVGALPLGVDAAIQQEIWAGDAPLHQILARHGVSEVTWRDHLRRRDAALRDEAAHGATDRARAERAALDRARRPQEEPEEPALDLATYAALRAVLDGSREAGEEAGLLAARGVTRESWDRDHRLYRKLLRERPPLADRFREALADAKKALAEAPAPADDRKRPAPKKPPRGAPRSEKKT